MLTDEDLNNYIPMNLNSVISLHQSFKKSLVKFLFINRQNTKIMVVNYEDKFNRGYWDGV